MGDLFLEQIGEPVSKATRKDYALEIWEIMPEEARLLFDDDIEKFDYWVEIAYNEVRDRAKVLFAPADTEVK